jgi:uncharacterized protein YjbJ (UPF0337 family)
LQVREETITWTLTKTFDPWSQAIGLAFAQLKGVRSRSRDGIQHQSRSKRMNNDQLKGKLKQMRGEIKRKWGQITDDDLTQAEGDIEKLVGKIQERTGERRAAIEKWLKQYDASDSA